MKYMLRDKGSQTAMAFGKYKASICYAPMGYEVTCLFLM